MKREFSPRWQRGTRVDVQCASTGRWANGFAIEEVTPTEVRVRRLSDGVVLPVGFGRELVRTSALVSAGWPVG